MSLELYATKARERAAWFEVHQRHSQLWGAVSCDESEIGGGAVLSLDDSRAGLSLNQ